MAQLNGKSKSRFEKKNGQGFPSHKGHTWKIEEKRTVNFKIFSKSTNYSPSAVTHTHLNYDKNISYRKPSLFLSPYEITMVHIQFVPKSRPLKTPKKGARDLTREIFFRGIVRNHRPLAIYFIEIKSSVWISSNWAKGQSWPISGDSLTPSAPNNLNFENRAPSVFFNFYYLPFLKISAKSSEPFPRYRP